MLKSLILTALVIAGLSGLGLKAARYMDIPSEAPALYPALADRLSGLGFRLVGVRPLTAGGSFRAHVFRHTKCPRRALVVLPLSLSAEGAGLLKRTLAGPGATVLFVYRGHRTGQFPTMTVVLDRLFGSLGRLWDRGNEPVERPYAVLVSPACPAHAAIDWSPA